MNEDRKKEKIKACIAIGIIILAILFASIVVMKYNVEGEKNVPYKLSKIIVVSTAEGVENEGTEEKWNFSIYQNNDVYFSIEEQENKENEIIESISVENIKISKKPEVGKIKTYMPNSEEGRMFSYNEEYIVEENELKYKGAAKSNTKTLEIGSKGGTAVIRFSNVELGNYVSNEEEEIKHDGSLLSKNNINLENIKFEVNFDLVINLKNRSYVTNISLNLPCGDDLIEKGTTNEEITEGFIYRRNKN